MKYQALKPHPLLANYIASYFFLEVEKRQPEDELIIPDGTHGLLFVQQSKFTRHCSTGEDKVCGTYLFGQKSKSVQYEFDTPGLYCFGAKFHPHGLKRFMEMPVGEIKDIMIEASQALGKEFSILEGRALSAGNEQGKKSLLDTYFIQKLKRDEEKDHKLVQRILAEIHLKKGQMGIAGLLQFFQIGYKRLERLFKKYVGLPPKAYCRIVRFNAALFYRTRRPDDNLTQLAYSAGYFDQMHFIKEIKHFTNLTPSDFFQHGLQTLGIHQRQLVEERFG